MSASSSPELNNVNDAWTRVGEAVNRATDLYLEELTAYLDWAHDLQHEFLEQSLVTTQRFSRLGEKQLAFFARMRENLPTPGTVPKGKKTVVGMVEAVVDETGREE